jgi:SAM-dependent methyltransferase
MMETKTSFPESPVFFMYDYTAYRSSPSEQARAEDLLQLVPRGRRSILDVGARDGYFSRRFADFFPEVTALDLTKPEFEYPGVVTMAGDATRLPFADNAFDCVFCAEVLEHIPAVAAAARELARVARHEVIIGVPFQQDTRIGRVFCASCGRNSPPWGHVNEFDEKRLRELFSGLTVSKASFVGENREATNALSSWLMDLGGNPWGTYDQEEPCLHCGAKLVAPSARPIGKKVCSALAVRLNRVQNVFTKSHGNWIHLVLSKPSSE